jgi:hypothetical protein
VNTLFLLLTANFSCVTNKYLKNKVTSHLLCLVFIAVALLLLNGCHVTEENLMYIMLCIMKTACGILATTRRQEENKVDDDLAWRLKKIKKSTSIYVYFMIILRGCWEQIGLKLLRTIPPKVFHQLLLKSRKGIITLKAVFSSEVSALV